MSNELDTKRKWKKAEGMEKLRTCKEKEEWLRYKGGAESTLVIPGWAKKEMLEEMK